MTVYGLNLNVNIVNNRKVGPPQSLHNFCQLGIGTEERERERERERENKEKI